jgi:hypothetical protein
MPSRQVRAVDPSSIISDIQARLTKLESFPPSGIVELTSNSTGLINQVYAQNTTPGDAGVTRTPSFTLIRPVPILVFGSLVFYPSGGTASYMYGTLKIAGNLGTTWNSETIAVTNGEGKGDTARMVVVPALPADSYTAVWNVYVDTGNTGTMVVSSSAIYVFQLAG